MAARRGVTLTEEHRDIIATGQLSMNELAGRLGISRQSLHTNFKRRGWSTTATADAVANAPAQPQRVLGSSARQRPVSARVASLAPCGVPPASASPGAPTAPAAAEIATAEELTEHARRAIAAVALAALDRAHEILSKPLGASALKAAVAASAIAADQLARAGFDVASVGDQVAPTMTIMEMTAAEIEATQAAVEREYLQAIGAVEAEEDADDAVTFSAEDIAAPRQRAA